MQISHYQPTFTDFQPLPRLDPGCHYGLLPGAVHELKLGSASQAAVSEWVRCIDMVFNYATPHLPMRTLTDARHSVLPALAYVSHMTELWITNRYGAPRGRNAILHNDAPLSRVEQDVVNSLACGDQQVRFFAPWQRDEALRWLLGA